MTRIHDQPLWHPEEDPGAALYHCEGCGDPVPDDRAFCSDDCRPDEDECPDCGEDTFFNCECGDNGWAVGSSR